MKIKCQYILLLFSLYWHFSFSQQYTNLTTINGLPSNHVYRISQDYQGFIWIFTDKGIAKYDGNTFKVFTTKEGLPSNDIWDFRITKDNKIWFFTKTNKLGYIKNDSVYTFKEKYGNAFFPMEIGQYDNNVFFYSNNYLYTLKDSLWIPKKRIETPKNNGFFTYTNHPVIKKIILKKDTFLLINRFDKILKKVNTANKIDFLKYRGQINDSLYGWLTDKNLTIINLNTLKINTHKLPLYSKFTRYNYTNDQVQITGLHYLYKIDTNGKLVKIADIPKQKKAHFSFLDKSGNLWLASFQNGIYLLPKNKKNTKIDLKNQKISFLQLVNNNIIASVYDKGFYLYKTKKNKFQPILHNNDYNFKVKYLDNLKSTFYLANNKTILNKNNKIVELKLKYNLRNVIYKNGFIYGYNSFGIIKLDTTNLKPVNEYNKTGIRDLIKYKNQLILATSNGLRVLNDLEITAINTLKNFDKPIVNIIKFNQNLIVNTDGFGSYITDLKKIHPIPKSDFLSVQDAFTKDSTLWLATTKGIKEYVFSNNRFNLKNEYTSKTSLHTNLINNIVIKNDTIFAGTNNGILIVPVLKKKEENHPSNIYFNLAKYNDKILKNHEKIPFKNDNHFVIHIKKIDFNDKDNLSYEFKLLPDNNKWQTSTTETMRFNNLQPNKYRLLIQNNNKTIKEFDFEITPLWYQHFWFKTFIGLASLAILLFTFHYYQKKQLEKQDKKFKIQKQMVEAELHALRSQMNPHFVFNSLNAIQYYITNNEIDLSEKYLVKFSRLIRMFFDFSREKEIPLKDEINLLKSYLEIEKMRFGKDFKYEIHVVNPQFLDGFKIPTMLLQPIVENAVNHGLFHNNGKGLIEIYFELQAPNKLKVTITDNGVGVTKAKEIQKKSFHKKKNNSTNIIKERLTLLNQSKKWKVTYKLTELSTGTSVELNFIKNEKD